MSDLGEADEVELQHLGAAKQKAPAVHCTGVSHLGAMLG